MTTGKMFPKALRIGDGSETLLQPGGGGPDPFILFNVVCGVLPDDAALPLRALHRLKQCGAPAPAEDRTPTPHTVTTPSHNPPGTEWRIPRGIPSPPTNGIWTPTRRTTSLT